LLRIRAAAAAGFDFGLRRQGVGRRQQDRNQDKSAAGHFSLTLLMNSGDTILHTPTPIPLKLME
jgi:hypothetical protein